MKLQFQFLQYGGEWGDPKQSQSFGYIQGSLGLTTSAEKVFKAYTDKRGLQKLKHYRVKV